jgi:hypothetical protein
MGDANTPYMEQQTPWSQNDGAGRETYGVSGAIYFMYLEEVGTSGMPVNYFTTGRATTQRVTTGSRATTGQSLTSGRQVTSGRITTGLGQGQPVTTGIQGQSVTTGQDQQSLTSGSVTTGGNSFISIIVI